MPRYFAQIDENKEVTRVVVCDDPAWLEQRLGGTWVETADPYSDAPQEVAYCGPGFGCDEEFPERFAPKWVAPVAITDPEPGQDPWTWYPVGSRVFHNGRIWRSRVAQNVWEPGTAGWHDAPPGGIPTWFQPTGSADAYTEFDDETGEPTIVKHGGKVWRNTLDANVWPPGEFGWEEVVETPPPTEPPVEPPTEPVTEAWVQPTGAHDAYPAIDPATSATYRVTHNGQTWENTHGDGNSWEPGVYGWTVVA